MKAGPVIACSWGPTGTIGLHYCDLDAGGPDDTGLLSLDEREQAGRYNFDQDRRRFVAARSFLRRILGEITDTAPEALTFGYTGFGKPFLASGGPEFNLSHSGPFAVAAVRAGPPLPVGVDLETGIDAESAREVAPRILHPAEVEAWRALPPELQVPVFRNFWIAKEALLKASGRGFSEEPPEIHLEFRGKDCRIVSLPLLFGDPEGWRVQLVEAPAPFPVTAVTGPL